MVSNDECFNKAFYNIIKGFDDTKDILNFMITVAGVSDPASIIGFDEYLNTEYGFKQIKSDDLDLYLKKNIDEIKEVLDTPLDDKTRGYYEEVLGFYTKLNNSYKIEKESLKTSLMAELHKSNRANILELLRNKSLKD